MPLPRSRQARFRRPPPHAPHRVATLCARFSSHAAREVLQRPPAVSSTVPSSTAGTPVPPGAASPADPGRWFREEVRPHESALKGYLSRHFPTLEADEVVQESVAALFSSHSPALTDVVVNIESRRPEPKPAVVALERLLRKVEARRLQLLTETVA